MDFAWPVISAIGSGLGLTFAGLSARLVLGGKIRHDGAGLAVSPAGGEQIGVPAMDSQESRPGLRRTDIPARSDRTGELEEIDDTIDLRLRELDRIRCETERYREERDAAERELNGRVAEIEKASRRGRVLCDDLEKLYGSLVNERQTLDRVTQDIETGQHRLTALMAEVAAAQSQAATLREEEEAARQRLAVLSEEAARGEERLRASEAEGQALRLALETMEHDRRTAAGEIDEMHRSLVRDRSLLAQLAAEIADARQTMAQDRQSLIQVADEIAAAQARHAQVAECTLEARARRDVLAGEILALCGERAELVERISALRIEAMGRTPDYPAESATAALLPAAAVTDIREPDAAVSGATGRDDGEAPPPALRSDRRAAVWAARAQSTAKPRNDSFDRGDRIVWRGNEDRFRLTESGAGLLAAVSDGAGASGLFCGAWAETLVSRLPGEPLAGIDEINAWMDAFCLDFRAAIAAQTRADRAKHSKFVREGSFATLTACWLAASEDRTEVRWIGYGDSPLLVFDRTGPEPSLIGSHPGTLAAFDRDPQLLNWMTVPSAAGLKSGAILLPPRATVVLASDGIGQFMLLRYLASPAAPAGALAEEFGRLAKAGESRLAGFAKAHAARPPHNFTAELETIRTYLDAGPHFVSAVAKWCEDGLLANDDSTMIMIDIERPLP